MRKLLSTGVVVAAVLATLAPIAPMGPAQAATNTIVSLTFDDGFATQGLAETALDAHGMDGTFYVNSNTIGTGGYLTWAQLTSFQAAGHEIAGHTLDHLNLDSIPIAQATTQVCQDRTNIMSHGLTVTDFAYPYGAGYSTPAVHDMIQTCGYSSARRAWGLYSSDPECGGTGCGYPYAATIPPTDVWAIESADNPQTATTLAQIEQLVTQAEQHGGGWVPLAFHDICAGCQPYSTTQATFQAFLDWLQPRAANGTIVKTMAQALGNAGPPPDTTAPTSTLACNAAACSSGFYNAPVQVSLSATDNPGGSGVASIRYTTDGSTPSPTSAAYGTPFTVPSTRTVQYRAYDNAGNAGPMNATVVLIDTVTPVSSIACNGAACSGWYGGSVQVSLSATDAGSGIAAIRYTTDASDPTSTSPLYSAPFTLSATTTVKERATDNTGNIEATKTQAIQVDAVAPQAAITCKSVACSNGWYRKPVQVSLSATDIGSGVAGIRYTIDGSTPTLASPIYTAPFTLSSSNNVRYRAVDNAGIAGTVTTTLVKVDISGPIVALKSPGVHALAKGHVKIAASATDARSGVASVNYYLDGHLVATDTKSPFSYSWAATMPKGTHKLTARAFDKAGNSSTKTITITVH